MQLVKISELTPHPRNNDFFDDVTGQRWEEFLESIKTSGVIEPIVITEDKVIVSGHQRVRACKELGIEEIMAEVKLYDGDDKRVLKDLIETNVRQRGTIGGSDSQIVARVEALKDWYGVHNGGNDKVTRSTNGTSSKNGQSARWTNGPSGEDQQEENFSTMKREDILKILGLTEKQYKTAKKIAENTIPEVQQLIEDGTVSRRTVADLIAKLSPAEQQSLVDSLPDDVKFSAKTIEAQINKIHAEASSTAATIQQSADELRGQINELKRENNALKDGYVVPDEVQERIDTLQSERDQFQGKLNANQKRIEQLENLLDKALKAKTTAEAAAKGGDEGILSLQNQLDEIGKELDAEKRKANDLEFQLSEKEDEIKDLQRKAKDGLLRTAINPAEGTQEALDRKVRMLESDIQTAIGTFIAKVDEIMMRGNLIPEIPGHILGALCHTSEDAMTHARRLWDELIKNTSTEDYNSQKPADDDDDYFDEVICEGKEYPEDEDYGLDY